MLFRSADVYWTEYFRVHESSSLEKWIVGDITTNSTGRPVVAQMIGNDIPALVRTAKQLEQLPIAAIDLNLNGFRDLCQKKPGGKATLDHGRGQPVRKWHQSIRCQSDASLFCQFPAGRRISLGHLVLTVIIRLHLAAGEYSQAWHMLEGIVATQQ